jgi:hypothetical protein
MKSELEAKLGEEFPFMRMGKTMHEQIEEYGKIKDLYGAFGCSCGDGWYELLRSMCSEIVSAYEQEGRAVDIRVLQVKEKFGMLRFYHAYSDADEEISALDAADGLSIRFQPGRSDFHKKIDGIIEKWETKSANVCMSCGKPGKLRNGLSWIQTQCNDCYKKQ